MTPTRNNYVTQIQTYRYPDKTYRLGEKTMQGTITANEAIRQSVYHILSTERYSNPIYGYDYGAELEKYLGSDFAYIQATIENTLRDALMQDDRITGVSVTSVEQTSIDTCLVKFTVTSIYGSNEEEIEIVQ